MEHKSKAMWKPSVAAASRVLTDAPTLFVADEVQAIASMMEKQARITVKPKEISQEEKQRKAALLAQYANVTDEEEYPFPVCLKSPSWLCSVWGRNWTNLSIFFPEKGFHGKKHGRSQLRGLNIGFYAYLVLNHQR